MGVLVPHPWDKLGTPPPVGQSYVVDLKAKPTATFNGFTDAKGAFKTWEMGCADAADCVMGQGETDFVEELMSAHCDPDEVLVWLIDPETGEFAS